MKKGNLDRNSRASPLKKEPSRTPTPTAQHDLQKIHDNGAKVKTKPLTAHDLNKRNNSETLTKAVEETMKQLSFYKKSPSARNHPNQGETRPQ